MASSTTDPESKASSPQCPRQTGYPALASVMGPFRRMSMYKRFSSLNSYSLLMRQAELIHLEARLQAFISAGKQAGLKYNESVYDMLQAAQSGGMDSERWELVLEIRRKLDEYIKCNLVIGTHATVGKRLTGL